MSRIGKFLEPYSYQKSFKEFMIKMEEKYGQDIFDLCGIGQQLDINEISKKFFMSKNTAEVSVDANANVSDKSVISHKIEVAKPAQIINSYYRLWKELIKNRGKEYAEHIIESQINGRIYINDFSGFSSSMPYCFNYSTYDTALMGIPSVFDGRGGSKPPKHLMAFLGQEELFSLIAGNSTLGATGLADLLIVMSIYIDKILQTGEDAHIMFMEPCWSDRHSLDEDNIWRYIESLLTGFIYRLNQPYRGSQSLFSNISIYDDNFLNEMISSYKLEIDGVIYEAKKDIVKRVQELYLNIMNNEMLRKPLTFPVTTACFSVDDDGNILDEEFAYFIAKQNLKFGFINIYCGKSSTLSSCCRLRSEQDNDYFNTFGAGSTKIGSLGVCTGNLPQLAKKIQLECKKEHYILGNLKNVFLYELKQLVIDCQEINNAKRNIVNRTIKAGAHPIYSLGYMDIKKQYSTFGVVGLYEALEILGLDIQTEEGQSFVYDILEVINKTNKEQQNRFKSPHNCEQIPAENVAVKLAKKDTLLGYNTEYELYSNQFIPLTKRVNLLDRIELQGKFDKHFSGGAICHLNVDQEVADVKTMVNLIKTAAKNGVVYFAINYVLQECEDGHMSVGNIETCSICGKKIISKYTRVVGFLTKVDNWIRERKELDFPNRQFYKEI